MASQTISPRNARSAAPSQRPVLRYVLLACLFTVTIGLLVESTIAIVHHVPAHVPVFAPGTASAALEFVDSKAVAAGLHRGDILLAINNRPYTGKIVLLETMWKATPGSTLAVTVRPPGARSGERTILLPVTQSKRLLDSKALSVSLFVMMPIFCIALGFWVVLVRSNDLSAWLLLGLLMSFVEIFSGSPPQPGWSPGLFKLVTGFRYAVGGYWPVFIFLFGFYFPEPLPYFTRPGLWRKWLPWIVVAPYAAYSLFVVPILVGDMVDYASVEPLQRALNPIEIPMQVYVFCLVSAFFALIFSKSAIAISADAKRRLRLLYWGAAIALTPPLLIGLVVSVRHSIDLPDWLISTAVLMFLIFPLTLAYVIVVQRAMDVRVVLRQGLQYALAKNGVRILQVLAILVVTLTALALIGQNRDRPQKIIVIAVGLLAIFTIRRMTETIGAWIDRRFFREAYDAEQVLSELSDGVRGMVDARSLIETVAERISETLHISRVAVLLGGGGPYRPAYALGYGAAPDIAFPAGGGTVKVLQRQKEPARVYFDDPHSWLYREPEVTEEDRSKLTQLRRGVAASSEHARQIAGIHQSRTKAVR